MKKLNLFAFFILIAFLQTVSAQNSYYVLNIKGTVKVKKTGAVIKINDQISDKDILLFNTPTDAVAVISTKNGRMVLRPKPNAKSSELVCVVSEILNPGTGRLSTRTGPINNAVDLDNYFNKDSLNVLGSMKVWISPMAFPMDQENFFFVRYRWNGETINKKLNFEKDSILLNAADIFKVDGKDIAYNEITSPALYYKKGASATQMCPFNISFLDEIQLRETITSFKKYSSNKGSEFIDELRPLLMDIYGNTDRKNVRNWVKKNIGEY
jgi:hypothetical protein